MNTCDSSDSSNTKMLIRWTQLDSFTCALFLVCVHSFDRFDCCRRRLRLFFSFIRNFLSKIEPVVYVVCSYNGRDERYVLWVIWLNRKSIVFCEHVLDVRPTNFSNTIKTKSTAIADLWFILFSLAFCVSLVWFGF